MRTLDEVRADITALRDSAADPALVKALEQCGSLGEAIKKGQDDGLSWLVDAFTGCLTTVNIFSAEGNMQMVAGILRQMGCVTNIMSRLGLEGHENFTTVSEGLSRTFLRLITLHAELQALETASDSPTSPTKH